MLFPSRQDAVAAGDLDACHDTTCARVFLAGQVASRTCVHKDISPSVYLDILRSVDHLRHGVWWKIWYQLLLVSTVTQRKNIFINSWELCSEQMVTRVYHSGAVWHFVASHVVLACHAVDLLLVCLCALYAYNQQ